MEDFELRTIVDESAQSLNALAEGIHRRADSFHLYSAIELRDLANRLKDYAYDLEMASLESTAQDHGSALELAESV